MRIAVTMGDSSGVGPEILLLAAQAGSLTQPYVVYGDLSVLELCRERLGLGVELRAIADVGEWQAGPVNVLDMKMLRREQVRPGEITKESGAAARAYVVAAAEAALTGLVAAMVTLPMNKGATELSDPTFTGHTELIGEVCGAKSVTIMLISDALAVSHVSTHVSLSEAIRRVTKERVQTITRLTCDALRRMHDRPRVAVAGLNPHAGEGGLFGREEIEVIEPAIRELRAEGYDVEGPVPPDTLFYLAVKRKKFEGIVCMYHDQGHIPMKLMDFESAVNVTLGVPIIRTSVDHGTAFDIAWQGKASIRSFTQAFDLAVRMAG
ncbi:MAG TPA: 4-hydroxythreonine-4-phosphate dehydrogenase PdxA [Paludibaculum sp.]|jgi:4-hydroxythreonine-4-phosphate dehydrogenase